MENKVGNFDDVMTDETTCVVFSIEESGEMMASLFTGENASMELYTFSMALTKYVGDHVEEIMQLGMDEFRDSMENRTLN
jgi:hypothetical protein